MCMSEKVDAFRATLTRAVASGVVRSEFGTVPGGSEYLRLGCPGGFHPPAPFWRLEAAQAPIVMYFGFVPNFTPADLMCKVVAQGEAVPDGAGASVQFNGDLSYRAVAPGVWALCHHGRVTVRHSVSRARLLSALDEAAPGVSRFFGGLDVRAWPLELGRTDGLPAMLDATLVWAYGLEQAKRSLRGEGLLPPLLPA